MGVIHEPLLKVLEAHGDAGGVAVAGGNPEEEGIGTGRRPVSFDGTTGRAFSGPSFLRRRARAAAVDRVGVRSSVSWRGRRVGRDRRRGGRGGARRPRRCRRAVAPAEDSQADQLVEVEPKDCGKAVLFAVGEG